MRKYSVFLFSHSLQAHRDLGPVHGWACTFCGLNWNLSCVTPLSNFLTMRLHLFYYRLKIPSSLPWTGMLISSQSRWSFWLIEWKRIARSELSAGEFIQSDQVSEIIVQYSWPLYTAWRKTHKDTQTDTDTDTGRHTRTHAQTHARVHAHRIRIRIA